MRSSDSAAPKFGIATTPPVFDESPRSSSQRLKKKYKIHKAVTFRQEDDGNTIAFHSAISTGFLVNPTSRYILDQCSGENDITEIASRLRDFYGGSTPMEIESIVEAHLSVLLKARLIEDVSGESRKDETES